MARYVIFDHRPIYLLGHVHWVWRIVEGSGRVRPSHASLGRSSYIWSNGRHVSVPMLNRPI